MCTVNCPHCVCRRLGQYWPFIFIFNFVYKPCWQSFIKKYTAVFIVLFYIALIYNNVKQAVCYTASIWRYLAWYGGLVYNCVGKNLGLCTTVYNCIWGLVYNCIRGLCTTVLGAFVRLYWGLVYNNLCDFTSTVIPSRCWAHYMLDSLLLFCTFQTWTTKRWRRQGPGKEAPGRPPNLTINWSAQQ